MVRRHLGLRRSLVTAALAVGALIGTAGVAQAANFDWYMSGVQTGFNSRTWNFSTSGDEAIESDYCDWMYPGAGGTYYRLQLTQETAWYLPDRNAGQASYACDQYGGGYGYHDFGSQPHGNYHFTYVKSDNPYGIDYADGYTYYP